MAGLTPSFQSGSNLALYIGGKRVAYGANLSFSDDVALGSVGGIGSFSYDTIEPLSYLARGNFSIVRYDTAALSALDKKLTVNSQQETAFTNAKPERMNDNGKGNSMMHPTQFNPAQLLFSHTFDIVVYQRSPKVGGGEDYVKQFSLLDCRMTSYSITFTPGSFVTELISFIAMKNVDEESQVAQV